MKYLFVLLALWLISCRSQRDGCGTENYKHKFRVEKVYTNPEGLWIVKLKKVKALEPTYVKVGPFKCLPDSLNKIGNEVSL